MQLQNGGYLDKWPNERIQLDTPAFSWPRSMDEEAPALFPSLSKERGY